jgi:hypothetical protein
MDLTLKTPRLLEGKCSFTENPAIFPYITFKVTDSVKPDLSFKHRYIALNAIY